MGSQIWGDIVDIVLRHACMVQTGKLICSYLLMITDNKVALISSTLLLRAYLNPS